MLKETKFFVNRYAFVNFKRISNKLIKPLKGHGWFWASRVVILLYSLSCVTTFCVTNIVQDKFTAILPPGASDGNTGKGLF